MLPKSPNPAHEDSSDDMVSEGGPVYEDDMDEPEDTPLEPVIDVAVPNIEEDRLTTSHPSLAQKGAFDLSSGLSFAT